MLTEKEREEIKKNVYNQLAIEDAVHVMKNYLASIDEDEKRYYRNRMQKIISNHEEQW